MSCTAVTVDGVVVAKDVWMLIFWELSPVDIGRCAMVCQALNSISKYDCVWEGRLKTIQFRQAQRGLMKRGHVFLASVASTGIPRKRCIEQWRRERQQARNSWRLRPAVAREYCSMIDFRKTDLVDPLLLALSRRCHPIHGDEGDEEDDDDEWSA
jgi:hypothetical protein